LNFSPSIFELERDKYFKLFLALKASEKPSRKNLLKFESHKIKVSNFVLSLKNVFVKFSTLAFFGSR
jgi:hypothetical protein